MQNYPISEVQKVYRLQGARSTISISRSSSVVGMCRKVRVTDLAPPTRRVHWQNRLEVENINAELQKRIDDGEAGIKLVGVSAGAAGHHQGCPKRVLPRLPHPFQETTVSHPEAANKGRPDPLAYSEGRNVIIGKSIPAGTGLPEWSLEAP